MKRRGRVLKKGDPPLAFLLDSEERLDCIHGRIDVGLSGWNHPDNSSQEGNIG
jgi:hypothetical protein